MALLSAVFDRLPVNEWYGDPLLDVQDRDDNLDVGIRIARDALKATRERVNAGHPEWGKLRMPLLIEANWVIGWGLDELKKLAHPGWVPLIERLSP